MTCPNCEQPTEPTAAFCARCGCQLSPAQNPPPVLLPRVPPVPARKKAGNLGRNLFFGCLLAVVLFVVLAVVAALFGSGKSPRPTVAEGGKKAPGVVGAAPDRGSEESRAPDVKPLPSPLAEEPVTEEPRSPFMRATLSSLTGRNVTFEATNVADGSKKDVVLTKTGYMKIGPYQAQVGPFVSPYAECIGFEVTVLEFVPKKHSAVCTATGDFEAKAFISVNEPLVPTRIREGDLFFMDGRQDIGYRYYSLVEKP